MNPEVISCIETEKLMKPNMYSSELQERLLPDGSSTGLTSKFVITKCTRDDIHMTRKKVQQIPSESQKNENIQLPNDFFDAISDLEPGTVQCFDETSVVKTTFKRKHGSAPRGEPAFEIQRYFSNATNTINLLHSSFGVDVMNVLEGPTNGRELLFIEEAANQTRRIRCVGER